MQICKSYASVVLGAITSDKKQSFKI